MVLRTTMALHYWFSGAFAKLRQASISFDMSGRMEQFGFRWTDFHEILYLRIFRKSVEKIQVSLKSNRNNGHFTRIFFITSRSVLLRMRNVADKSYR